MRCLTSTADSSHSIPSHLTQLPVFTAEKSALWRRGRGGCSAFQRRRRGTGGQHLAQRAESDRQRAESDPVKGRDTVQGQSGASRRTLSSAATARLFLAAGVSSPCGHSKLRLSVLKSCVALLLQKASFPSASSSLNPAQPCVPSRWRSATGPSPALLLPVGGGPRKSRLPVSASSPLPLFRLSLSLSYIYV